MKNVIYILIQCTWGLPQTLLGFIVLLINIKNRHYFYHGAIITERNVVLCQDLAQVKMRNLSSS